MKTRKVINLHFQPEGVTNVAFMLALCDDGTMWHKKLHEGAEWEQINDVPQPTDYRGEAYQ